MKTPTEVQADTIRALEAELQLEQQRRFAQAAENAHLRTLLRIGNPPPYDQQEVSRAFTTARESGRSAGEMILLQLRARQRARDLTADSFAPMPRS